MKLQFNFLLILFLLSTTAQDKQVAASSSSLRNSNRSLSVASFERLLGYISQPSRSLMHFKDFISYKITKIEKNEFAKFYSKLDHGRYLFLRAFINKKMDFINKLLDNGFDIRGLDRIIFSKIKNELFYKFPHCFLTDQISHKKRISHEKRVRELGLFLNRLIDEFGFNVNVQIRHKRFTKRREEKPYAEYALLNTVIEEGFEFETIKKIIDAGADLNWKSATQFSPLRCAIWRNRVDVFDYLVSKGADLKKSIKEEDLLELSWSVGEPPLLERIIELTESNFIFENESNLINDYLKRINLKNNCDRVYYSILSKLVKKFGANGVDKNGRTPLFFAQSKEVVDLLLNNGADINHQDNNGDTSLKNAILKTCSFCIGKDVFLDIAKYLIFKCANVNVKDRNGRTPLFFVQSKEAADLLLNNGADINHQDNNGNTIIHHDVHTELLNFFLKKGADVNLVNNKGETAAESLFESIHHFNKFSKLLCKSKVDKGLLLLNYGANCDHFRIDILRNKYDVVSYDQMGRYKKIKAESLERKKIQESIEKYLNDQKPNSFFSKVKSLFSLDASGYLLNKINYGSISTLSLLQAVVLYKMIDLDPIADYQKYSKLRIALLTIAKKTAQYVFALDKLLNNNKNYKFKFPLEIIEEIIYIKFYILRFAKKSFTMSCTQQEIILKSGEKITFQELVRQEYQKIYENVYAPVVDLVEAEVQTF